jgi:hypothetical protein
MPRAYPRVSVEDQAEDDLVNEDLGNLSGFGSRPRGNLAKMRLFREFTSKPELTGCRSLG